MAVTVKLGGYEYAEGGVRHDIQVNGEDTIDREEEFVVHLEVTPGRVVRAVMEYAGGRWQCRLTAPDDTKVLVDQQPVQGPGATPGLRMLTGRVASRDRRGSTIHVGIHLGEGLLPVPLLPLLEVSRYHRVTARKEVGPVFEVLRELQIGQLVSFVVSPGEPDVQGPQYQGYWVCHDLVPLVEE